MRADGGDLATGMGSAPVGRALHGLGGGVRNPVEQLTAEPHASR